MILDKIQSKDLVAVIAGKKKNAVNPNRINLKTITTFGSGKDKEDNYWKSIIRTGAVVQDFFIKRYLKPTVY